MDDLRGIEDILNSKRGKGMEEIEAEVGNDKFSKSLTKFVKGGSKTGSKFQGGNGGSRGDKKGWL